MDAAAAAAAAAAAVLCAGRELSAPRAARTVSGTQPPSAAGGSVGSSRWGPLQPGRVVDVQEVNTREREGFIRTVVNWKTTLMPLSPLTSLRHGLASEEIAEKLHGVLAQRGEGEQALEHLQVGHGRERGPRPHAHGGRGGHRGSVAHEGRRPPGRERRRRHGVAVQRWRLLPRRTQWSGRGAHVGMGHGGPRGFGRRPRRSAGARGDGGPALLHLLGFTAELVRALLVKLVEFGSARRNIKIMLHYEYNFEFKLYSESMLHS